MVRAALNRGAALVAAMLIAALAAAVVATLAAGQSQWLRTVELRRDRAQAQAIVLAGLAWTRQVLQEDAQGAPVDHLGEPWALPLPPTPLEGGVVDGVIVDAQGRLDVNHLAGEGPETQAARERMARLFAPAGLDARAVDALLGAGRPDGVRFVRAAEIAALEAIGEAGHARVARFVTALPAPATINVNTAPPEVLAAVLGDASAEAVAALVAERARKPFGSLAEFRSRIPSGAKLASDAGLGVRSDFFLVTVRARQGATLAQGRAMLQRRARELPEVVWQSVE
ncbi:MAG: type II secretion system minor pseudopilin GspK [Betaproteobacteria bacterium]|jgi:general secretion pathway protein K|nr:type II secretion system minor pseudopilin GspK [Betaproteobacteria bacterium]